MRILSYNIRKAKGGWRARTDSHEIAVALRARRPDLVLCQEVFHARADDGDHQSRALGDILEFEATYGRNAVYSRGHHGNATLTKYTIIASKNFDLSTNPIERRGLLWAQLEIDGRPLHVFNTHLGLNVRQRITQTRRIVDIVGDIVHPDEPMILAGDFNDWNGRLDPILVKALDVTSSLSRLTRKQGASFPNLRPFLALDRLFWRGLDVDHLRVLRGEPWSRISDHLPLEATLTFV